MQLVYFHRIHELSQDLPFWEKDNWSIYRYTEAVCLFSSNSRITSKSAIIDNNFCIGNNFQNFDKVEKFLEKFSKLRLPAQRKSTKKILSIVAS